MKAERTQDAKQDLFGEVPAKPAWLFNQVQLAEILRTSTVTIKTWERKGMPVHKPGDHGQEAAYALPDVVEWRVKHLLEQAVQPTKGESLTDATIKKLRIETSIKELEFGKLNQDLLEAPLVQKGWEHVLVTLRTRFLALPRPLAQEIDDADERIRLETLWETRIRQVLESIANAELPFQPEPEPNGAREPGPQRQSGAPGPAAAPDRQPVGRAKAVRQPRGRRASRPLAQ